MKDNGVDRDGTTAHRAPHGTQVVEDGERFDWIIVGSGFGGSVSALRLAEKGYRVAVLEKGRRLVESDFPKRNWNLKRWMWMPALGFRGLFKMTPFRHVTTLSGVGVGGGSLVYANTLPVPQDDFFRASSWAHLADWKAELAEHYQTARRMLGATPNPRETAGDRVLREIARDMGREGEFGTNEVAVFFGDPEETVPDPFFDGEGPARTGCRFCGGCMTGCRYGAKNTLDKNYLWLAERRGVVIQPDTEVRAVRPREAADGGYDVEAVLRVGPLRHRRLRLRADRVVFAGGVLGTVDLLQRLREDPRALPKLSPRVGADVRTNSEALLGVVSPSGDEDFSEGIAITSIFHTDEHSHIEPVRYARGSGFFRLLVSPHAPGRTPLRRVANAARSFLRQPGRWARALVVWDWARHTQILLYMRTLDGTLRMERGRSPLSLWLRKAPRTKLSSGPKPAAAIPEASDLAERFAEKVGGVAGSLLQETLLNIPTTAHILGGCCMGEGPETGAIDRDHRLFGYDGLYVIDGSAVSANPGVNPSLTITALAERAMSKIPPKGHATG